MTADVSPEPNALNRRASENLTTLMFRLGWNQKAAAQATGMVANTLSRKLKCLNDWTLPEIEAVAAATSVEVAELLGDLPEFDAWRARRDSNPKPSDP